MTKSASKIRVKGIVQGVGFRPFIYVLAKENDLSGWVLNDEKGVEIHIEGSANRVGKFIEELPTKAPAACRIDSIDKKDCIPQGFDKFEIVESKQGKNIVTRMSPDMVLCENCKKDMENPQDIHFEYPYVNCTHCGPRYSIIKSLPYDRVATTMSGWPMCELCRAGYENPLDRRFHAQPVACPQCGPEYYIQIDSLHNSQSASNRVNGMEAIKLASRMLLDGKIVAVKGIGGYHLALDASNDQALTNLRERKYRKDKPFALMPATLDIAKQLIKLDEKLEAELTSIARPITIAEAKEYRCLNQELLAPDNNDLGVMLPYTPLHHLLFKYGAPQILVMTSANKSNEPIAYEDKHALSSLEGIADAYLVGERPIQRRIDDSVITSSQLGIHTIRRARGMAPDLVVKLPVERPILALGADLKNTVTLVVKGQAFVSQYIGDLEHLSCFDAFKTTISDFCGMYSINEDELLVVNDLHPQYISSQYANELECKNIVSIQHHKAHIASVLAEYSLFEENVLGVAFDGTGWGEDEAIWGGEFLYGSLSSGLDRVAHLSYTNLPGGDAAAKLPAQSAAGFLHSNCDIELDQFREPPFDFPEQYSLALQMLKQDVRCFKTSSVGRLFDAASALIGFSKPVSFEAQAAIWLEHLARRSSIRDCYEFRFDSNAMELNWQNALLSIVEDRRGGRSKEDMARAFHNGLAKGIAQSCFKLREKYSFSKVVISGGVFQNMLLTNLLAFELESSGIELLANHKVPANDGGISIGQSALACWL